MKKFNWEEFLDNSSALQNGGRSKRFLQADA